MADMITIYNGSSSNRGENLNTGASRRSYATKKKKKKGKIRICKNTYKEGK